MVTKKKLCQKRFDGMHSIFWRINKLVQSKNNNLYGMTVHNDLHEILYNAKT